GVPRAVPLHLGRAGQRDAHGAAPDLQLRVRELARRRLRHGYGAQSQRRRLPLRLRARLPARDAVLEHAMSEPGGSGLVSELDWQKPSIRWEMRTLHALLLVGLGVIALGPILWLAKSAITPTIDTISHPMALFPHGAAWSNLSQAWNDVHVGRYFWDTVVIAFGSWAVQIVVATTGGFALSVLRPRYAPIIKGLLLATLFVPAIVLLVPLYIEVVRLPLVHKSLINSYWALWLPYSASA